MEIKSVFFAKATISVITSDDWTMSKMEHRYSKRIAADLQVMIYQSGLPIAIGRVRNMSRHGIFIDCTADTAMLNQPLGIELLSYWQQGERSSRFMCFVVRKEIEGIALCLFDDCQTAYARYVVRYADAKERLNYSQHGLAETERKS